MNLARSIDVELSLQDIDRSHRPESGDIDTRKPRNIIVKFATYRMRAKFYKARVLTKSRGHRGVFVNEHFTKPRGKLMYQARQSEIQTTQECVDLWWCDTGETFKLYCSKNQFWKWLAWIYPAGISTRCVTRRNRGNTLRWFSVAISYFDQYNMTSFCDRYSYAFYIPKVLMTRNGPLFSNSALN